MSGQYVSEAERVIADASRIIWGYVIRSFDVDSSNISPSETAFMYGAYHYSVIDILEEWHKEEDVRDIFIPSAAFLMNADPQNRDNVPVFLKMRDIVDNMISMMKADCCDSQTECGAVSIFNLRKEVFKIDYSEFDIKYFLKNVKSLRAEIREGIRQAFISANSSNRAINNTKNNAHKKESFGNRYIVLILTLFLFLFFAILVQINKYSYTKPVTKVPERTTLPALELLAKTPPAHGRILKYPSKEAVAPLEIQTSGSGYFYFVLTNSGNKDSVVMKFFAHAEKTLSIDVPLGKYDLYYAYGDTWYGTEKLFGDETIRKKCEEPLLFSFDGDSYTGWTLTLYPVKNGNMDTAYVSEDDFP